MLMYDIVIIGAGTAGMSAAIYGCAFRQEGFAFGREELWWSDCEHSWSWELSGNN